MAFTDVCWCFLQCSEGNYIFSMSFPFKLPLLRFIQRKQTQKPKPKCLPSKVSHAVCQWAPGVTFCGLQILMYSPVKQLPSLAFSGSSVNRFPSVVREKHLGSAVANSKWTLGTLTRSVCVINCHTAKLIEKKIQHGKCRKWRDVAAVTQSLVEQEWY